MLIEEITAYCDNEYTHNRIYHVCRECRELGIKCRGNSSVGCANCLDAIHYYHGKEAMQDYICPNLINFYTCRFSYKYASEIISLLEVTTLFDDDNNIRIMSIGCGPCPDLMALETFLKKRELSTGKISYVGLDINEIWKPIHNKIKEYYKDKINIEIDFLYNDAIDNFDETFINNTNIIILQYLFSSIYNTKKYDEEALAEIVARIETFLDKLILRIIFFSKHDIPFAIIINDVNSCNCGRDFIDYLTQKIRDCNLSNISTKRYYFNSCYKRDENQTFGRAHRENDILYDIPSNQKKYDPRLKCTSVQLLIDKI